MNLFLRPSKTSFWMMTKYLSDLFSFKLHSIIYFKIAMNSKYYDDQPSPERWQANPSSLKSESWYKKRSPAHEIVQKSKGLTF